MLQGKSSFLESEICIDVTTVFILNFVSFASAHFFQYWHAVTQLVEALRYKPEGCWFDSRWSHWNLLVT
jgi:hypothetical protein